MELDVRNLHRLVMPFSTTSVVSMAVRVFPSMAFDV
jgi:hypothetical protein